jgi:RNA polymerase sigma-70 factor (ECF subfamily)
MLRRLATVKGLDVLRRRVRERERRGVMEGEVMAREAGPEEQAERAELVGRMREALGELPGEQAEVFCLRHVSGMSYEEIGAVMGMTGNAVGVVLTRAKGKLRELMESSEVRHDG